MKLSEVECCCPFVTLEVKTKLKTKDACWTSASASNEAKSG